MECPVCNTTGIDESSTHCPECKSELIVFSHLKSIERKRRNRMISLAILGVLLTIVVILWIVSLTGEKQTMAQKPVQSNEQLEQLKKQNEQLKARNDNLTAEINDLKEKISEEPSKKEETYTVKEGETLFIIARKIYGNGFKYHQIAEDNNIENPDMVRTGKVLKVYY